jgi:hypothetical protein
MQERYGAYKFQEMPTVFIATIRDIFINHVKETGYYTNMHIPEHGLS